MALAARGGRIPGIQLLKYCIGSITLREGDSRSFKVMIAYVLAAGFCMKCVCL